MPTLPSFTRRALCLLLPTWMLFGAAAAQASEAEMLAEKLASMRSSLEQSTLMRPVVLQASDTPSGLKGEVFAIVDHPLSAIAAALGTPEQWCEAMLLHVNNRACEVSSGTAGPVIALSVVRRYDSPLSSAFRLAFDFQMATASPRYVAMRLHAPQGPFGTSDYRIDFEAIPVDATRSFLRFSYAYSENTLTSVAMQAYLATFGRSKVGFTVTGQATDGQPEYIRGMRGLVERNAMRYFLAVDAQLAGHDGMARRNAWFSAIERYPRQLREIDRATYLSLKAEDTRRTDIGSGS